MLACRGVGSEVKLGYESLTDLLSEVDEGQIAELPAPQRRALQEALLRAGPADGSPPDSRAVATGFLTLVERLGETNPVSSVSTSYSGSTTRRPRLWVSASVACAAGSVCSRRGATHQSHRPATPSAFARRIACGRSG